MSTVINVPEGWESNSISKIVKLNPESITTRYSEEFEIEYIDISSITNFHVTSTEQYKLKNAPSRAKRIIKDDYIIFSTVRPYLRAISFIDFVGEKNNIVCSTGYAVIKTKEIVIQSKYLFYYTQQDLFINEVMRVAEGSNYPAISDREFKLLDIKYPKEIKEQQRIAEILSTFDKTIEASQKLIAKEKNIKKGLMHDLLTNGIDEDGKIRSPQTHRYKESELGLIPEGWEVKKLADVGQCKNGLTYSPSDITNGDGLLVLRSSNIQNSKLAFNDNVFVRDDIRLNYKVQEGDILVCVRNGSKKLIGKNALITKEAEGMAHGAFMTIFHSENYKYIFQLFQSDMFFQRVEKNLGATINSINNSDLVLFEFPFPKNKLEQEQIANILTTQDKKIQTEEKNLFKLKELKKGLMDVLLSGKVRVKV